MDWFEALILGLVQGLTEFLPISSSGHLAIGKALFGIESSDLLFEVTVHTATVLSTIVVFWKEIASLVQGVFKFKYNSEMRYAAMIGVSLIPVMIVGFFFKSQVEVVFGAGLAVVGSMLLLTALLLFVSERLSRRSAFKSHDMGYKDAIIMGLAQAVAVLPGLSRSGTTIAAGLFSGADRSQVAKFSFLMVIIPILGEAFLSVVKGEVAGSSVGLLPLAVGFLAAFLSGLFACRFMISVVKKARLSWFSLYCIIAAAFCFIYEFLM